MMGWIRRSTGVLHTLLLLVLLSFAAQAADGGGVIKIAPVRSTIAGLTMANNSTQKIDIAAGQAADSTNAVTITVSATCTVDLAASGDKGLDSGSVASSSWYAFFVTYGSSGTSCIAHLAAAATVPVPTLPAGFAYYRYVGQMKTDGSSNLLAFTQVGDVIYLATQIADVAVTNLGTSATLYTLTVPLGLIVQPIFRASSNNALKAVLITSGSETDVAPNANPAVAPAFDLFSDFQGFTIFAQTNTSGQVRARADAASSTLDIVTRGWRDYRGVFN